MFALLGTLLKLNGKSCEHWFACPLHCFVKSNGCPMKSIAANVIGPLGMIDPFVMTLFIVQLLLHLSVSYMYCVD